VLTGRRDRIARVDRARDAIVALPIRGAARVCTPRIEAAVRRESSVSRHSLTVRLTLDGDTETSTIRLVDGTRLRI
jgi:hypothetical protein